MSRLTHIFRIRRQRGFTLVETLAAISLITIAIVAPMALTVQSLQAAYYARDQITASNLAQEGIEAIRSVRDGNILATAKGTATDLFQGIWPVCQTACYVDATTFTNQPTDLNPPITACNGVCPALRTGSTDINSVDQLYGYNPSWTPTNFTRTVVVTVVRYDSSTPPIPQEIRVAVTVSWQTAAYKSEHITLYENLYNWINTGSAGTPS